MSDLRVWRLSGVGGSVHVGIESGGRLRGGGVGKYVAGAVVLSGQGAG